VAVGQQRDQQSLDERVLTNDATTEICPQARESGLLSGRSGAGLDCRLLSLRLGTRLGHAGRSSSGQYWI
jgi:hypothetical protein